MPQTSKMWSLNINSHWKSAAWKEELRQNSSEAENIVSLTGLSNPERKEAIQEYLNHVRWTQQPNEQALTDQSRDNLKYQKIYIYIPMDTLKIQNMYV